MPFIAIVYATTPEQVRAIDARYSDGDAGRIVGVYALPAAGTVPTCRGWCKAGPGWTRDASGVMVHACGGRHPDWRKRIRVALLDMFGINRLPRSRTPAMFQNPEGYDK
jgi:hypothetical protein